MGSKLRNATVKVVVFLGVAGGSAFPVNAQMTSGPGLSSGSGAGTGAGGRTGELRNQSGSMSGVGPGPASGVTSRGRGPALRGPRTRREFVPFGPGVDVTFPTDPYLIPFLTLERAGLQSNPAAPTVITDALLKDARLIATPEERSLALQRIANGAIASNQLILAHHTVEEATSVTSDVRVPLVRDQRLIALVKTITFLTEAFLREGHLIIEPLDNSPRPEALPKQVDSQVAIRMARLEWRRAVYLAKLIDNPTYRNEMLYRVAESEASGSATVA